MQEGDEEEEEEEDREWAIPAQEGEKENGASARGKQGTY